MKKLLSLTIFAVIALPLAAGLADSTECGDHNTLPGSGTEGFSFANEGDVQGGAGALYICNSGSTVPAPAKGHAEIGGKIDQGNPAGSEGHVMVDGDATNSGASCTDGFVRVDMKAGQAPVFYNGGDGDWKDTNGSASGSPDAQPKSADQFVTSTADECQ